MVTLSALIFHTAPVRCLDPRTDFRFFVRALTMCGSYSSPPETAERAREARVRWLLLLGCWLSLLMLDFVVHAGVYPLPSV